jgi:hypothetical protein
VLQHGEQLCPALVEVNKTSYGKQKTSATVASVRLTKPNLAVVTFTIRVAGQVVLPDSKGYAVLEDGEWKVAANTFCQLLTLQGSAPEECKDKSFTALPHKCPRCSTGPRCRPGRPSRSARHAACRGRRR